MCRCGYEQGEFHPCHGGMYTCRKPALQRFLNPQVSSLAGFQMKFTVSDTWACDDCWEDFKKDHFKS